MTVALKNVLQLRKLQWSFRMRNANIILMWQSRRV